MGNLIQKDDAEKVLKIELPDGTEGEIPILDATQRGSIIRGDMLSMIPELKEGGVIKEYDKGEKVRRGWVKDYEERFKTKEELEAEKRKKAPMQKTAKRMKRARKKHKRKGSLGQTTVGKTKK